MPWDSMNETFDGKSKKWNRRRAKKRYHLYFFHEWKEEKRYAPVKRNRHGKPVTKNGMEVFDCGVATDKAIERNRK